jgi:hypothetical protein
VTVDAELLPTSNGATAALRLPTRLQLPDGRHPVTFPKTDTPVAYAVIRDGALRRLEGPAYVPSTRRRLLDAVADNRQVRRVRKVRGRLRG